jgi:L-alanine-DL-glutamate epimerase-like enolase superfamily enzyme
MRERVGRWSRRVACERLRDMVDVRVGMFALGGQTAGGGAPAEVAEFVRRYVEAGCSAFNVIPCAEDAETAIAAVGELRRLLSPTP